MRSTRGVFSDGSTWAYAPSPGGGSGGYPWLSLDRGVRHERPCVTNSTDIEMAALLMQNYRANEREWGAGWQVMDTETFRECQRAALDAHVAYQMCQEHAVATERLSRQVVNLERALEARERQVTSLQNTNDALRASREDSQKQVAAGGSIKRIAELQQQVAYLEQMLEQVRLERDRHKMMRTAHFDSMQELSRQVADLHDENRRLLRKGFFPFGKR